MKRTIILIFTATASYFIIYILLKFFLQNAIVDWQNASLGATTFGFFVLLVHRFIVWKEHAA